MRGRMGWRIAKLWQARNATSPFLSDDEKKMIAEEYHKTIGNVEQAIRDTWARYMIGGRQKHVVRRKIPKARANARRDRRTKREGQEQSGAS